MPEITIASLRDTRPLGGVDPAVLHIPAIVGVEVEVERGRGEETGEGLAGGCRAARWQNVAFYKQAVGAALPFNPK